MKVTVKIECETGVQVVQHLYALIRQTKQELRKAVKKPDPKLKRVELYDDNCYGTHWATIKEFDNDDFIDGVPVKKKSSSSPQK